MAPRGARKNTLPRNLGSGRVRTPLATGQRRRQEAVPREGHRPHAAGLAARPQYAGGGTGSRRPSVSWVSTRRDRDRAHTTPLPVAAVVALPCSRRSRRPPCADPSPTPAMTLGGSAAGSARPQRGQLPSRTPCSRNRPEPRKGAEPRGWNPEFAPIPHSGLILRTCSGPRVRRSSGPARPAADSRLPAGAGPLARPDH